MTAVSVVIPTRNRANLLKQAIQSVVHQSWPEVEAIVVDEASKDSTPEVLDHFSEEIRVIRHSEPKGLPAVRNIGAAKAKGDYVLYLDDDDLLHPNHIEELVRFSQSLSDHLIASSGWRRFQVSGGDVFKKPVVRPPERWGGAEAITSILGHEPGCLVWTSSILWPRSVLDKVKWDQNLQVNEEVDFFCRTLMKGYSFAGTKRGMAYYRVHRRKRNSDTSSKSDLISSAKCRLKQARLLNSQSFSESVAPAVRESLMRVLINIESHGGLSEWADRVKSAYADWGGESYYLPQPPQHQIKRFFLNAALTFGGPKAVGGLLRLQSQLGEFIVSDSSPASMETTEYSSLIQKLKSANAAHMVD